MNSVPCPEHSAKEIKVCSRVPVPQLFAVFFLAVICSLTGTAVAHTISVEETVDYTIEPILEADWVCYKKDSGLFLQKIGEKPVPVRKSGEKLGTIISPDILVMGESVYAAWIEKGSNGNTVLMRILHHGEEKEQKSTPITVAEQTKAMFVKLYKNRSENRVYVLDAAVGEKPEASVTIVKDKGASRERKSLTLSGYELYNFSMHVSGEKLHLLYYGRKEGKGFLIVQSFDPESMNPDTVTSLKEVSSISFIETLEVRDTLLVLYKTRENNTFVLEGFRKTSADWEPFSLKDAEGMDIARIDTYSWKDGEILILLSGEKKGEFKQRIYAASSSDCGKTWNMQRIDNKEYDNTRSWLPRITVSGEKVVAVWEDSREIRARVRMRISADRGKTWSEKTVAVSDGAKYSLRPRISTDDENFFVVWYQYRDDERKVADLAMLKATWDDIAAIMSQRQKQLTSGEKEALLRKKVNQYWKSMLQDDVKTAYEIHDPFYRARMPFDYHKARCGSIKYHAFSVEKIELRGNVASVKVNVRYEVPSLMVLGQETSLPEKEIMIHDTYLFLDGTWHRQFIDPLSEGSAIQY